MDEKNQENFSANDQQQTSPFEQPTQAAYVQTPKPVTATSGLAVGGLVTGIVAIVGSWIPFFNIVSLIIGIVALGLSIPALIITLKGTKKGKGLAITGLVLGAATIIIFVVMTIVAAAAVDEIVDDAWDDAWDDAYSELLDDPEYVSEDDSDSASYMEFLEEYEAFVDDYIALLEKYEKDPTNLDILNDYIDLTADAVEWAEKAEAIEGDLTGDDLEEYLDALVRITNKLTGLI